MTPDPLSFVPTPVDDVPCCDDVPSPLPVPVDAPEAALLASLPPQLADALQYALTEITQADHDLHESLFETASGVGQEIGALESTFNSTMDELVGAADLMLADVEQKGHKVFFDLLKGTDRDVNHCFDWCISAGLNPPWHPAEQCSMAAGDPIALVAAAVPSIGVLLGGSGGSSETPNLVMPETVSGYPTIPVNAPGISESPTSPWNNPGFTPGGGGSAESSPGLSPGVSYSTTSPGGSGCPPVNVTVNVPPIIVRTTPGDRGEQGLPGEQGEQGQYVAADAGTPLVPMPPPPASPPGMLPPEPPRPPNVPLNAVWTLNTAGDGGYWKVPQSPVQPPPPGTAVPVTAPTKFAGGAVTIAPPQSALLFPSLTMPPMQDDGAGIDWNKSNACGFAAELVRNPITPKPEERAKQQKDPLDTYIDNHLKWPSLLAWTNPLMAVTHEVDQLRRAFTESTNVVSDTIQGYADRLIADTALAHVSPSSVHNINAALYYGARLAAARFAEDKTKMPLGYLYLSDEYMFQYSNPQELPNQIRVDDAFLNATINEETWVCWTRANGSLPEPARTVMLANQNRPGVSELIQVWRRGFLSDKELFDRARERGVLDPKYVREWVEITKALPTQGDLIRFMVRDAADESVATKYQYDKDFTDKYTKSLQRFGRALGLDDEYFKLMWRSHWEIPSYTQLREMFHRLRPDRPEVKRWDKLKELHGEGDALQQLGLRPPVVTLADIQEALEVNDLAPRWVTPQISVSYTPINRTDAVRAYMIGAFDSERLYNAFRDIGYSEADSNTLVSFHSKDKARRRTNVTGGWSPRKIVKNYKLGYVSKEKAFALLQPLSGNPAEALSILDQADDELAADTRAAAIKGVRRAFNAGEYDADEAVRAMMKFGTDQPVAERNVAIWQIDRDTRYKVISAAQVATMLKKSLISGEEASRRLANLGYRPRDRQLIIAKALGIEGSGDGLDDAELDQEVGQAINNKKVAGRSSDRKLGNRLKSLWREVERIYDEVNKRRRGELKPELKPGEMP